MGNGRPRPNRRQRVIRHGAVGALSLAATIALVGVVTEPATASSGSSSSQTARESTASATAPRATAAAVQPAVVHTVSTVQQQIRIALARVDAAENTLAGAKERTLDDEAIDELRTAVTDTRRHITTATVTASGRDAETSTVFAWRPHTEIALAAALAEDGTALENAVESIDAGVESVDTAVEAWEAEQERLAREAERKRLEAEAARAAEAAAAAAAASNSASNSGSGSWQPAAESDWSDESGGGEGSAGATPAPAPSGPAPADWSEYVWTSGFQSELDSCAGSVDLSGVYGVRVVGEHWHCGGAAFPTWSGATVDFTGVVAGRYRVAGIAAVLDGATANSNDIPGGYDLLYQTCLDNSTARMAFVGLVRIG